LELKLAGIRALSFNDFFLLFGTGRHAAFGEIYLDRLRAELSPFAQEYWDSRQHWFMQTEARNTFYFHGLSGIVARAFRSFLALKPTLRDGIDVLLEARSLDQQREIYESRIAPALWTRSVNWALSRQITMSMLGVPRPQRKEVERQHAGGIGGFVREAIEYVVCHLPIWTNYFWAHYLRGRYTLDNCPEYLKKANFEALKAGLADRISIHGATVTDYLRNTQETISKYVLLDHMDWMSSYHPQELVEEWNAILARATSDARVIMRSAHVEPAYLQGIAVGHDAHRRHLMDALHFHPELARELQRQDRVHTYAGFHIADVRA
jgi:S-adenosylmethionine-diacylglycerol 3-amino-3-carboxypropyl transferase